MWSLQTLEGWLRATWDLQRVSAYKTQVVYPVMFLHSYESVFQALSDLLLFDHGSLRGHSGIRPSVSKRSARLKLRLKLVPRHSECEYRRCSVQTLLKRLPRTIF